MAPASANSRRSQREQTRRRLLNAFADEFERVGYARANIERVVGSLGLTRGAFYGHFDSISDVAIELLDEVRSAEAPELDTVASSNDGYVDLVDHFAMRRAARRRDGPRVSNSLIAELLLASRYDDALRIRLVELYEERSRSIASLIGSLTEQLGVRLAESAPRIAHIVMALEVGLSLADHLDVDGMPAYADELLEGFLLRGAIMHDG